MREKKFENEQPTIWIQGRTEGDRSLIVIRDNGPGIEQKNLDKIFDPFFTTKDVGEGMGLGLSICYRIVQEYGGQISVKTEAGTILRIYPGFPRPGQTHQLNWKWNMENLYDYKKFAILYVDDEEKSLTNFTRAFGDQFRIFTGDQRAGRPQAARGTRRRNRPAA